MNLPTAGSYLIAGPPGTGKTVLAIYRAKRLVDANHERTQLIMYSRLLAQYTSNACKQLGVEGKVSTFNHWFKWYCKRNLGFFPPEITPFEYDWVTILQRIMQAPRMPDPSKLPYLIVDEGQDLPPEFYLIASKICRDFIVFADQNQRIQKQNSLLSEIRDRAGFTESNVYWLRQNYRNSRPIAELAAHFYTDTETGVPDLPAIGTSRAPKPRMIHVEKLHHSVMHIVNLERNFSNLQIGVFVPTVALQTKFRNRLEGKTKNPVQFYNYQGDHGVPCVVDFEAPGIVITTYQGAKGLEFDLVVIPELQELNDKLDDPHTRMRFYVMISRAREQVHFTYSGEGEPAVLSMFPKKELDWN
jgi:superfamily I DNA/RNA helicase